jgi:ribulose-5-phosphate 4-epimerase/fuculose-1-phosphate aldolase
VGATSQANLIVIKPSGIKYEELKPEDMVVWIWMERDRR